jgi:hypothetical protein
MFSSESFIKIQEKYLKYFFTPLNFIKTDPGQMSLGAKTVGRYYLTFLSHRPLFGKNYFVVEDFHINVCSYSV